MLASAHRKWMADYRRDFDWFIYTEDDILIPEAAFNLAREKYHLVRPFGAIMQFIRVENNVRPGHKGAPEPFLSDGLESSSKSVEVTPDGSHWSSLTGYAGAWIVFSRDLQLWVTIDSETWRVDAARGLGLVVLIRESFAW